MMDWDRLRVFHVVATAESLTRAGEQLNLSQSAVSRQIAALEESLQISLFSRHARGLALTEQGEILLRAVSDMLGRLAAVENLLHDSRHHPKGPLKITAPTAIGTLWLTPHMREFCDLYPDIRVTLLVDDHELDLLRREADVALRLSPARHGDLIEKKLTSFNNSLYASSGYLRTHGAPRRVQELSSHRLVAYTDGGRLPFTEINWALKAGMEKAQARAPFFTINSMRGMAKAVESGIGIAGLPDYLAQDVPGVVKVLPELRGPVTDLYYTYPMELRDSKRVRVLKEFLLTKLSANGLQ